MGELLHKRTIRHDAIIEFNGYSPWGYRIFHAYIIEWLTNMIAAPSHEQWSKNRTGHHIIRDEEEEEEKKNNNKYNKKKNVVVVA